MKRNKKKNKLFKPVELFKGLDEMWLYNWNKLNETNDLKWLVKRQKDREKYVDPQRLDDRFIELMDEWFELTDASSNRKELYVLIKKLINARNKVIQGDKFQMNWVNKFERMIEDLLKDNVGYDPDKERMKLSAELKMHIDSKTITVKDYHLLVEVTTEKIKAQTPQEDGEEVYPG